MPDLGLLPSDFPKANLITSYAAYWLKNSRTVLADPLDVSILDPLPDFIKFSLDLEELIFILQTNETSNVGNYTIVYVKTFES